MGSEAAHYSEQAERAVIGALMYSRLQFDRVSAIVDAGDFFEPRHAHLFEICARLIASGGTADPGVVYERARTEMQIEPEFLTNVMASLPALASIPDYARLVAELATKRAVVAVADDAAIKVGSDDWPADKLAAHAESGLHKALNRKSVFQEPSLLGSDADDWLAQAENADGSLPGVSTGLKALDQTIGGLQGGDLIVLAGRPSMGKTATALGVARAVACADIGVHLASAEMDKKRLWHRMLSDIAREHTKVSYSEIGRRRFYDDEAKALSLANEVVKAMPLIVDERAGPTVEQVAASARRSRRRFEAQGKRLGLVVVDYLQLMAMDRDFRNNPSIAVGLQTKAMKDLAKELGCAVLLLSQLNRAVESREGRRPTMADLRQSGEIEQDADVIALMLRPEYYTDRDPDARDEDRADARGVLKLFIDKNRNGPIAPLTFDVDIACNAVRDAGVFSPVGDQRGFYREAG